MAHRSGNQGSWPGAGRVNNKDLGQRFTPAKASPAPQTKVIQSSRHAFQPDPVALRGAQAAPGSPEVPRFCQGFRRFARLWTKGKQTLDAWRAHGIPATTQKRIEWHARRYVTAYGLPVDSIEDIEQDFYLKVWTAIEVYEEGRSTAEAFAGAVIELYYKYLVREIYRQKRRGIKTVPLLDMLVDEPEKFVQTYGEQHAAELRLDIETVLENLPQELRELAEVLSEKTPAEIAGYIGVHRGTIYRWIERLRDECGENFDKIR
jgi:RNA polymerase sigma factor (sigma-70 family)